MDDFEKTLWDVYEGRATFEELLASDRQRRHFRSLAASVLRRWQVPPWHSVEDVEQDMVLAAWTKLWDFDPSRGIGIKEYLVYNAYDKAKKSAHRARGAIRSGNKADSNPSRFERAATTVWSEDAERRLDELSAQAPRQEARLARAEALDAFARTEDERAVLRRAEAGGFLAELLAGDEAAMAECAGALVSGETRVSPGLRAKKIRGAVVRVVEAVSAIGQRMQEAADAA